MALLALACGPPSPLPLPRLDARAERMIDGLHGAAALALLPDGRIAVAEPRARGGAVRLLDPRRPDAETRVGFSLHGPSGVAVDRELPSDRRIWITGGSVVAAVETDGLEETAGESGAGAVFPGGAIAVTELPGPAGPVAVGPNGRVYVGIAAGDPLVAISGRGRREAPGAIVRLNPEGTVPVDNPRGPRDPVWASGLGNPAALDVDPDGSVWVADPAAGRVVRLSPGDDAGWPLVRGRANAPLEWLAARQIGAFRPAAWTPDRGTPLSVLALRSPVWGATAAVGLDDGRVVRLRVEDPESEPRAGPLVDGLGGPVVGLAEGPDGRLWALTPSAVWRIDPPGSTPFDAAGGARADTLHPSPRSY